MTFEIGQTILRRNVHHSGRIAAVETARVIRDDERGALTWTGPGSQVMRRTTLTGEPMGTMPLRRMPLSQRVATPTMLSPGAWHGGGILVLTPGDVAHSVWWFFGEAGEFRGWYVNLEAPALRWYGGLDTRDHALDIWMEPDRTWQWKDEGEFAERTGHPAYWDEAGAAEIRAEGERVVKLVEAGAYPFDGSLTDFRPDPSWGPTVLPPHWDVTRTAGAT